MLGSLWFHLWQVVVIYNRVTQINGRELEGTVQVRGCLQAICNPHFRLVTVIVGRHLLIAHFQC